LITSIAYKKNNEQQRRLAAAQPMPAPKVGSCPAGYRENDDYCAPTFDRAEPGVLSRNAQARQFDGDGKGTRAARFVRTLPSAAAWSLI
jgi:hypothetical protein